MKIQTKQLMLRLLGLSIAGLAGNYSSQISIIPEFSSYVSIKLVRFAFLAFFMTLATMCITLEKKYALDEYIEELGEPE